MEYIIALTLLPPVGVTAWHFVLIFSRDNKGRPSTISEHAVEQDHLLLIHRIVHTLPILAFLPFILFYLWPNGYVLAGALLILATTFDSIETLTLNKKTASLDSPKNLHYVTAWVMAICYLGYLVAISIIAGINPLFYGSILAICAVLLYFAINNKYKSKFVVMQVSFFALLAILGIIAHASLLFQEIA